MKIAIPTANGLLCAHFGHCSEFTLVEADSDHRTIISVETLPAPEHEPGLLPRWLRERGADLVIAGGMGSRAQDIFTQQGMEVCLGASVASPTDLVTAYLDGTLETGVNLCDH